MVWFARGGPAHVVSSLGSVSVEDAGGVGGGE